jgi:hypothetical protein
MVYGLDTPGENWLLSFSSPPFGGDYREEAGCENPFFNSLLGEYAIL